MWKIAEPVVREWIERHLGPSRAARRRGRGRAARSAASSAACRRCSTRGAALVEQLDAITRDGLVLAPETVAAIGRAEARRNRWTAVALWVIAALLAWIVIWLLHLIALIAMQSSARLSLKVRCHGQPDHPQAR